MRGLVLFITTLAVLAGGCVVAGKNAPAPGLDAAQTDSNLLDATEVAFRYTMFNTSGRPMLTNQYAVAVLMAAQDPTYVLLNSTEYVEIVANLTHENATTFGPAFESYVRKGHAGETILTEVIPANQTITGTDGITVALDRVHGPFPLVEEASRTAFARRFPNATAGSVVQLNTRFQAQVERMDAETVAYRYLVSDGSSVPYPELGPSATLTTVVDAERGIFFDRIDVPVGAAFARKNDRVLGLTHGNYFIQGVTDDEVVLGTLRTLPQYAFEDVYFIVEIVRTS